MILVTGATGFIGTHLVKELYRKGYRIRCLVRARSKAKHIRKSDIVIGDMRDLSSLLAAAKSCTAVVHLAAPIGHDDYKTNHEVTVAGTRNLIEACKRNGVKRLIFMSSIMAAIEQSNYGRTKLMAEKMLLASGLHSTILRGDWIYGEYDWGLSKLAKIIGKYPFVVVPGNGEYRKRPIYIRDVVSAIIACLNNKRTIDKTYMLGGSSITYNDMLDTFCKAVGISKRKLHAPLWIFFFIGALLKVFGVRAVTKNNILGLTLDCSYDISKTEKELKLKPISFEDGLLKCGDYYKKIGSSR